MKHTIYFSILTLFLILVGCTRDSENENRENTPNSKNSESNIDSNDSSSSVTNSSNNLTSRNDDEDQANTETALTSSPEDLFRPESTRYKYDHSSLEQFLKTQAPEKQEFIINNSKRDHLITCKNGTKILIPKKIFVDQDGNQVKGNITLSVVEYYKYSDMIAGRMSTSSNGKALETGGMVEVRASQDGEEIELGKYQSIGIEFNSKESEKEDMQMFQGEFDTSGMINWTEQEKIASLLIKNKGAKLCGKDNIDTGNPIEFDLFEGITLTEDEVAFFKEKNFPELPLSLTFDNDGNVSVTEIARLPKPLSNRIIQWFSEVKCPKTQSLYLTGELKKFTLSFTSKPLPFKFNGYTPPNTKLFEGPKARDMFKVTDLGWINCDRFYEYDGPKSRMIVKHNMTNPPIVFVLLPSYRSLLEARFNQLGQLSLNGIPVDEEGTVYAIQVQDEQIYFAKSHVKMGNESVNLSLRKISEEEWDSNLFAIDS